MYAVSTVRMSFAAGSQRHATKPVFPKMRSIRVAVSCEETTILRPDIAGLLRAAYDPVLPPAAQDKSHALRLFARMSKTQ